MKVVVPMAGRGVRFASVGINTPKPLIEVLGRPMVAWALRSLEGVEYSEIYFIALEQHEKEFAVTHLLKTMSGPRARVILLEEVTEGQLCTVLAARNAINCDEDLLIMSSDTFVISSLGEDIACRAPDCQGIISVARMPGDRWSFARTDEEGRVVEVAEKRRISDLASTGIYYFTSGREFVTAADKMVRNGAKTYGEYYVIPVYQKYIERGWRVQVSLATEMWDLGTPETLKLFEQRLAFNSRVSQ